MFPAFTVMQGGESLFFDFLFKRQIYVFNRTLTCYLGAHRCCKSIAGGRETTFALCRNADFPSQLYPKINHGAVSFRTIFIIHCGWNGKIRSSHAGFYEKYDDKKMIVILSVL